MPRIVILGLTALAAAMVAPLAVSAQTAPSGWSSLVADRVAMRVGDSLTVLILESAQASNTARRGTRKATRLVGEAAADSNAHRAEGAISGTFDGVGESSRTDRLVASISAVVVDVLPNGDLRLSGEQSLLVNGEKTVIRLSGRARPADITETNTLLSSRMADARIEYSGSGFGARSARPGIVPRVLDRLGLF
jgi:flagellar L-ring protein precursor FlgH